MRGGSVREVKFATVLHLNGTRLKIRNRVFPHCDVLAVEWTQKLGFFFRVDVMSQQLSGDLRSTCPLAAGLDLFGDKWTLLIVRDMILHGRHRYGEFLAADERIPTNILAGRLRRLEAHGIIEKRPYQQHPVRYEYHLTEKGRDLEPVMRAIISWGLKHVPGTGDQPLR